MGGGLQVTSELEGMTSVIEKINSNKSDITQQIRESQLENIKKFKEESIDSEDCSTGNSKTCKRILGPKNTDGSSRGCILKDGNCVPLPSKEELNALTDCSQGTSLTCNSIGGPDKIGCNFNSDTGLCVTNEMIDNDDCGVGNDRPDECNRIMGPLNWRGPGKGCIWIPGKKKQDGTRRRGECQVNNLEAYQELRDTVKDVEDKQEENDEIEDKEQSEKASIMEEYQKRKDKIDVCLKDCQNKCNFSIVLKSSIDIDSPEQNKEAVIESLNKSIAEDLNIPSDNVSTDIQGGKRKKTKKRRHKFTQKGSGKIKQNGGQQFELLTTVKYPPTQDNLGGKTPENVLQEQISDINSSLSAMGAKLNNITLVNSNKSSTAELGRETAVHLTQNDVNIDIPLDQSISEKILSSPPEIKKDILSNVKSSLSTNLNIPEDNILVDFSTGGRLRRKISSKRGIKKYKKYYQLGGGYSLKITVFPPEASEKENITKKLESQEIKDSIVGQINSLLPSKIGEDTPNVDGNSQSNEPESIDSELTDKSEPAVPSSIETVGYQPSTNPVEEITKLKNAGIDLTKNPDSIIQQISDNTSMDPSMKQYYLNKYNSKSQKKKLKQNLTGNSVNPQDIINSILSIGTACSEDKDCLGSLYCAKDNTCQEIPKGGKIKKTKKYIIRSKKTKRMIGGNNSKVPLQNCGVSEGIKCCVDNSLRSVQTANKPIYYGNINHPFNNAINIAKNLQPGNDNSSWSKWSLNNIGGRRFSNKILKNKKTKSSKLKIKKSKKSKK